MAIKYILRCEKCKYDIEAIYGANRNSHEISKELTKKYLKNKGDEKFQRIYNALKYLVIKEENEYWSNVDNDSEESLERPWVGLHNQLYECENCGNMFNHDRLWMVCDMGEFIEKITLCTKCNKEEAFPIDEEEIHNANFNFDHPYTSDLWCSKCGEYFKVIEVALID